MFINFSEYEDEIQNNNVDHEKQSSRYLINLIIEIIEYLINRDYLKNECNYSDLVNETDQKIINICYDNWKINYLVIAAIYHFSCDSLLLPDLQLELNSTLLHFNDPLPIGLKRLKSQIKITTAFFEECDENIIISLSGQIIYKLKTLFPVLLQYKEIAKV